MKVCIDVEYNGNEKTYYDTHHDTGSADTAVINLEDSVYYLRTAKQQVRCNGDQRCIDLILSMSQLDHGLMGNKESYEDCQQSKGEIRNGT